MDALGWNHSHLFTYQNKHAIYLYHAMRCLTPYKMYVDLPLKICQIYEKSSFNQVREKTFKKTYAFLMSALVDVLATSNTL